MNGLADTWLTFIGYVGAYSEIAFNAAVCTMKDPPSPEIEDSKIILPPKENFPPQKPERTRLLLEVTSPAHPYLPPREYCDYYVARFFEEVHCIYWLYPIEQFHARLDDTYVTGSGAATSSWLCSLYAIFALGAASNENSQNPLINDFVSSETRRIPDAKTSESYLALAKALVPAVHDEADIDSIRALAILVRDTLQYCKINMLTAIIEFGFAHLQISNHFIFIYGHEHANCVFTWIST